MGTRFAVLALACAALTMIIRCGGRTGLDVPRAGQPPAPPGPDASPPTDAAADVVARCGDGGPSDVAYVLDSVGNFYRYQPETGDEILLGTPDCGDPNIPWTMTAGRDHAYIVYTADWSIFRVDLPTLECSPTPFVPNQLGLDEEFGVALTGSGASEQLYYYGLPNDSSTAILAVSDTVSFALTLIGNVDSMTAGEPFFPVNLTSDNAGHLFAYAPEPSGYLLEIDPTSGAVLLSVDEFLPSGPPYATLSYLGSVYLFANDVVTRFEPPAPGPFSSLMIDAGAIGAGSYVVCP
jgi:hypothetical protein